MPPPDLDPFGTCRVDGGLVLFTNLDMEVDNPAIRSTLDLGGARRWFEISAADRLNHIDPSLELVAGMRACNWKSPFAFKRGGSVVSVWGD